MNENVNGCLPIDAEAWNTKSHESRPEAGDDSESSDRLRQSQWVSLTVRLSLTDARTESDSE